MNMHTAQSGLVVEPDLIRKYDVSGPRYTSYPTADRFVDGYGEEQCREWLAKRNIGGISQPLSVYVHLPFCESICYYCGCNKVVTRDHSRAGKYIRYLERELALVAPLLGDDARIRHLHWGGGTPNFLAGEEMAALMRSLNERLPLRSPRAAGRLQFARDAIQEIVEPRVERAGGPRRRETPEHSFQVNRQRRAPLRRRSVAIG